MQDTETVKLPTSQKTVVLKGYVTGYIDQQVQRIRLGADKTRYEKVVNADNPDNDSGDTKVVMEMDPSVQIDADNKLMELMVVSLDGVALSADNAVSQILDLPKDDVSFILTRLKGIEADSKVASTDPKVPTS